MPASPQQRYPLSFHLCNSLDRSTRYNSASLEIGVENQVEYNLLARDKALGSESLAPQTSKLNSEAAFAAFGLALNLLCLSTVPLFLECWRID